MPCRPASPFPGSVIAVDYGSLSASVGEGCADVGTEDDSGFAPSGFDRLGLWPQLTVQPSSQIG